MANQDSHRFDLLLSEHLERHFAYGFLEGPCRMFLFRDVLSDLRLKGAHYTFFKTSLLSTYSHIDEDDRTVPDVFLVCHNDETV